MSRLRTRRSLAPVPLLTLLAGCSASGAGAPAFSPSSVAGLQLWLKADAGTYQDTAGTTPAVNSGDVVGKWTDQSGNGNNALQATTANKPTILNPAQNGLPGVNFNGTSDSMSIADALGLRLSTAAGIFAVVKFGATANQSLLAKGATAAAPDYLYQGFRSGDAHPSSMSLYDGVNWYDFATSSIDTSHWFLLELLYSARTMTYYVDGTLTSTLATTEDWHTSANPLYLGEQISANLATVTIGELVIYNQAVAAGDRQNLENYFAGRWVV